MNAGLREQIIRFNLQKMKQCITAQRVHFIERDKNLETIFDLGLTVQNIHSIICGLSVSDYHKGPEEDDNGTDGSIWVFLHPVSGRRMYLKLKLYKVNGLDYLKILSFHESL